MGEKMDVIRKIEKFMEERGRMSQYRLSEQSGIAQSTLSSLFRRRSALSIATLEQICGALDLTLSQFFFDPETETRYPLTESQRRMVDKWAALTPEQQRILMELIEQMQQRKE